MDETPDSITVLHVDDDSSFTVPTGAVRKEGREHIDVVTATNARDGLELIATDTIDCVVSEYELPDMDGLAFLDAVRDRDKTLPFILVTGHGSEAIASEAISRGVTDYLQKQSGTEQDAILADRISSAVATTTARTRQRQHLDAIQTAREGISILDDERFVFVNEAYAEIYGYHPDALIGEHWELLYPDADVKTVHETIVPAVERDGYWRGETIGLRADGSTFVEDHCISLTERGELVCTVRNISDEKERDAALRELSQFREAVIQSANVWINVLDESGNVVVWNGTAERISGYDAADVVGHGDIWEWLYPDEMYRTEVLEHVSEILNGEKAVEEFETTIETADGDERLVAWYSQALTDVSDDLYGSVAIGLDVTEQAETKQRLQTLIENLPGIVYRSGLNPERHFEFVQGECEALTGYTVSELREEVTWTNIVHPADLEHVVETVDSAVEIGDAFEVTYRIHTREGERRWVWERGQRVGGNALEGFITDVTEHKEREQAFERQNDRLESFANIVSHDLRNPLNVALGQLELAREDSDSAHLDDVAWALERMSVLVTETLTLARDEQTRDLTAVDLRTLSEACWRNVETPEATLVVDTDRQIRADRNRLQQLLENLFRNAIEHSSTTPDSRLRQDAVEHSITDSRPLADSELEDDTDRTISVGDLEDGFYVEDDGPGIPPAERERVFENGYSTAERGTGLGLSIVADVVEGHGWDVTVTDGDDGGARFEISGVDVLE